MSQTKSLNQVADSAIEYIEQQGRMSVPDKSNPLALGADSHVATIVNETLKQLIAIKPAWKAALGDKGAVAQWKKSWTVAFAQNGIQSLPQIELGIKRAQCDASPFLPSVGQFIEWCNPAGIDETEIIEAFARMIDRKRAANDIEYATRLRCGFACKNLLPHDKAIALFSSNMKLVSAKVARGEHIASLSTPMLENKAPSARDYFEQQMQQREPKTYIEARIQRLRLQQRRSA